MCLDKYLKEKSYSHCLTQNATIENRNTPRNAPVSTENLDKNQTVLILSLQH